MSRKDSEVKSASGVHLWLVLWKAYSALQRQALASIADLGLGFSDFGVLEALLHKGPLPVNTIGAKVNLTSGSISVAVDRLEARGWVERGPDPRDRRTRLVRLTAAGRTVIERAFACHKDAMERATAGLSKAEQTQAITLLRKLGAAAAAPAPTSRAPNTVSGADSA